MLACLCVCLRVIMFSCYFVYESVCLCVCIRECVACVWWAGGTTPIASLCIVPGVRARARDVRLRARA